MGVVKIIQFNANHSSGAQALALQFMTEKKIDLGIFSEPWHVPENNPRWFHSTCKRAAIYCNDLEVRKRCRAIASSEGWSGIEMGDIFIASCYLSPNEGVTKFKHILEDLGNFIEKNPHKILIGGDFNARSVSWGCNTGDRRGTIFEEWSSELNLAIVNTGGTPTCVRPQGSSIVDLTLVLLWTLPRVVG